jgi:uncharacterized metal-binding protein YceD (DUF177 family)
MGKRPQGLYIRVEGSTDGEETLFEERLDPDFLDLPEGDELVPSSKVEVRGTAYRAGEWIVVEGRVETSMSLPCATCNEQTVFPIGPFVWKIDVLATNVKNGMLDLTEELREAILLEVPHLVKCGGEVCRNESTVRQYLVSDEHRTDENDERYQPFRSLL